MLTVDMLVHYGSLEDAELWKSTSGQIQDGGRRQNWTYLNRNNSAADCSISLKFRTWVHHASAKAAELLNCWICRHYVCIICIICLVIEAQNHCTTSPGFKMQCVAIVVLVFFTSAVNVSSLRLMQSHAIVASHVATNNAWAAKLKGGRTRRTHLHMSNDYRWFKEQIVACNVLGF